MLENAERLGRAAVGFCERKGRRVFVLLVGLVLFVEKEGKNLGLVDS